MDETERTQLYTLARIAAAHAIGDQQALAAELRTAVAGGITWDQCYEALLHLVAYTGYPRTLNAMMTFRAVSNIPAPQQPTEPWAEFATDVWPARGVAVFKQLWPERELADSVRPLSPELAEWVVNDDFGRIFGRAGLTLLQRETLVVGALIALRVVPQLRSHRLAFRSVGGDDALLDDIVAALHGVVSVETIADARHNLSTIRAES